MEIIGLLLLIVGGLAAAAGGLWLLFEAFQESLLWGLGSLLIPFVSLVFVVMYWERAKSPFLLSLAGTVLALVGIFLSGPEGLEA